MVSSPGQADYKVRLKDQDSIVVAEFDTWRSLHFTHLINSPGMCRFEVNGRDSRIDLFELDGQIEIWRRNPRVGLDWYIEWEGLHRTAVRQTFEDGDKSFIAYQASYLDLMRRRVIAYASGLAQSNKSDPGETVIKELADENAGPGANDANRKVNGVTQGLSIEADDGNGTLWTGGRAWKPLLKTLQEIAIESEIDFDVIGTGVGLFEFRTYTGQRGEDRSTDGLVPSTGLNGAGNAPVIFSLGFGNMATPSFSISRFDEVTVALALGRGLESDRTTEVREATAASDSPWNRIEATKNASNEFGEDALRISADALLDARQKDENFTFVAQQLVAQYYGKDYTWGDLITARYDEFERNKKITEARITVSNEAGGEEITLKFADIPKR